MTIIAAQCRAARGLVNMTTAQLAAAAVVPILVIFDFEGGWGKPIPEDLASLRTALERAGVEFIDGDNPGVRHEEDSPGPCLRKLKWPIKCENTASLTSHTL